MWGSQAKTQSTMAYTLEANMVKKILQSFTTVWAATTLWASCHIRNLSTVIVQSISLESAFGWDIENMYFDIKRHLRMLGHADPQLKKKHCHAWQNISQNWLDFGFLVVNDIRQFHRLALPIFCCLQWPPQLEIILQIMPSFLDSMSGSLPHHILPALHSVSVPWGFTSTSRSQLAVIKLHTHLHRALPSKVLNEHKKSYILVLSRVCESNTTEGYGTLCAYAGHWHLYNVIHSLTSNHHHLQ